MRLHCWAPAKSATILALNIGETRSSIYLDLESEADRAKLSEPALYLASHGDKLVILDEVHRLPNVFQTLRGLIDRNRRRTAHRPVPATRLGFHRSPQTIWRNTGWPHSIS
ncbi:AAA family ATPase [Agrobacterium pusense]|uniref:AAA family ATPase n=1 Tax=Rhizobium/Agrobacterium group TaxID=227290 RepID=UPI00289B8E61|nr:AAA family ATPase [Agrobacterium pusense]